MPSSRVNTRPLSVHTPAHAIRSASCTLRQARSTCQAGVGTGHLDWNYDEVADDAVTKLGDQAAWAPRIKQGMDALLQSALKGKGAMPPKGGNASLSDADVRAATEFMVSQAK